MRVLHLFDWFLPSTLSWVSRLLVHMPDTEIWVGAPWVVRNRFCHPAFRVLEFPLQRWCFPAPVSEWDHPFAQRLFARSQRFVPVYPSWLFRKLRNDPPELLHAHYGPTGCLYLPLARRLNRPLIVTFYGFDYRKLLRYRPVFRKKYRQLFEQAAQVIAASPPGCEALQALGCPPDKLAVVKPCPDYTFFPYFQHAKPAGRLNLVQAATFTEKKGQLTTLEAFRLARKECPNLQLTLAGERYDRAIVRQVRAYIRDHGLQPFVTWTGAIPHEQMASFLSGFDLFIHPSRTAANGDHEASPVVLLEAQATGLPVLATRHFDLPETVSHGQSGWLVPEGDAGALADAIRRFYHCSDDAYQLYRRGAHAWATGHFSIQASATQLRNLYHQLR